MAGDNWSSVVYRQLDGARLTLPRDFRQRLAGAAAISAGIAGCVNVTVLSVWQRDLAALREGSMDRHHTSELLRLRAASELTVHVDKRGRIFLPRLHMEWAQLTPNTQTIVLVKDNCAEVWDPQKFAAMLENANRQLRQLDASPVREQLPLVEY